MLKNLLVGASKDMIERSVQRDFENMGIRLDADTQLFITREVEAIMSKTYDVVYPELKARDLFPINREVSPGAKTFTYYQYDQRGMGKIIANYAKDFPRADINMKPFTGNVREIGASYGYSQKDLWSSVMAGLPLEARKANVAKRSILQKENQIAFNGDATNNLGGFLSNPNITNSTIINDGTGSSKTFASKSTPQILRDINQLVTDIVRLTKGVEAPDTLLLPPLQYAYLAGTPYSTLLPITILDWIKQNHTYYKNIESIPELTGAGVLTPNADVMVAYKRSPDKLGLVVTLDFMQLPPQLEGAEWVIPCMSGTGGVVIYYPLSVAIGEGI